MGGSSVDSARHVFTERRNRRDVSTSQPEAIMNHQVAKSQELQELELAFLGSLVPGIIHNLATPLSGVLGATQLLEKRTSSISELLEGIDRLNEAERAELDKQLDRNRANVDILARNAKHLADILQCLVQRINRGASTVREFHSLNELLQNELRFLESNLTFKHKVKKQVTLGNEVPTAKFVYGNVSTTIDEFIVTGMESHDLRHGVMEMDFITEARDTSMALTIEIRYQPQSDASQDWSTLHCCLDLLRSEGWIAEYECGEGRMRLCLQCPKLSIPS